jgi:hypothetical protein
VVGAEQLADGRPLMVGADAVRFVLIGAIPVAVWAGVARIELLCVPVIAAGVLTVPSRAAGCAERPAWLAGRRVVAAAQLIISICWSRVEGAV